MLISASTFNAVFPNAKAGIYTAIDKQIERAGCTSKEQQAMFLAQCGHETAGFSLFIENLNYSASGLLKTFPKYFTASTASQYARQPEKIANRVYANRLGNGNEASGDGWKYRGRGLIQITGRTNYVAFESWLGRDISADEVGTDTTLIVAAGVWYWQANNLARYSSVITVTRRINGGTNGLSSRKNYYKKLLA